MYSYKKKMASGLEKVHVRDDRFVVDACVTPKRTLKHPKTFTPTHQNKKLGPSAPT